MYISLYVCGICLFYSATDGSILNRLCIFILSTENNVLKIIPYKHIVVKEPVGHSSVTEAFQPLVQNLVGITGWWLNNLYLGQRARLNKYFQVPVWRIDEFIKFDFIVVKEILAWNVTVQIVLQDSWPTSTSFHYIVCCKPHVTTLHIPRETIFNTVTMFLYY